MSLTLPFLRADNAKATNLGMLVIIFFSGIFGGLSSFAASIICTGGITLIIYVPLAWVIGKLIFWLISFLPYQLNNQQNKNIPFKSAVSNEDKAISNYIQQARSLGLSDVIIKNKLLTEGGWLSVQIDKFF